MSHEVVNSRKLIRGGENCFQALNYISVVQGGRVHSTGCNCICMIVLDVYSSSGYIFRLFDYDPRYVVYEYRESRRGR